MNQIIGAAVVPPPLTPGEIDTLYEVVNGQRVELPPMGAYETDLASVLTQLLGAFARAQNRGRVEAEMLFLIDQAAELQRRPDVAFVSYERWPRNRRVPRTAAWNVVPELAIEVVSPSNTAEGSVVKVQEYFRAGVQRVWVVFPDIEQVYAYDSPTAVRILVRSDELDGDPVLPGFRLPLATLFEAEATEPA
ncbi:MAG TPA: Uma2 family endonuclease [Gemmataceae bacterium]|nr:Uma2 family endonuclease [Gemmataceae bacterium]